MRNRLSLVVLLLAVVIAAMMALMIPGGAHASPSGFAFLEVPAGARASALSGAFASLGEGVEAGFWNPAGLAAVKGVEIEGAHFESFQNLRHDQFAVAKAMLGGGVAASLRAFYSEPITARDELGNEIGTFGGNDLELGLSYGRPLAESFRIGGGVRILHERIADLSTDTYAFAAGASWQSPEHPGLRLAAMADHIGPDANFTFEDGPGQAIPMPMAFQVAPRTASAGRHRFPRRGTRSRMVRTPHRRCGRRPVPPLRPPWIGTRMNDDATRFSAGAGYTMGSLRLDYAFVADQQDIGDSHRFSFTAHF